MKTLNILTQLRALMKKLPSGSIKAYIITATDAHSNEYLAPSDKRRDFVSGFTGSAGTAVVTEEKALLWTDGRYFLQASQQLDENWTLMKIGLPSTPTIESWLADNLPAGSQVGADPWLTPNNSWKEIENVLDLAGHSLIPISPNLVDLIWTQRPKPVRNPIVPLPVKYSGKDCLQKVESVRFEMKARKASVLVLSSLDEIAWLFNLRGSDIEYNPLFFSYAIITQSEINLFVDESQVTDEVLKHFKEENVTVKIDLYENVEKKLAKLLQESDGKIWLGKYASYHLHSLVPAKRVISAVTPVCFLKAIKNEVEIKGLTDCHVRDGAALCCYFAWLESNIGKMEINEIQGADKLNAFRQLQSDFMGPSFETISSAGPNGAVIHYQPKAETARAITNCELYLCDSGGQYKDGTTDVTRTLHFGTPTDFERECFTRVLKGQIALATAVFPRMLKGNYLDGFARKALWEVGLEYLHGTSHGIGHFLNVHEGPMGISWRLIPDDPGLREGMFLSNEPGYYDDGNFGIRLENIIYIVPANTPYHFQNTSFLTFKTVTLCPIQTKMINADLLTQSEVDYINNYHAECRETVGVYLKRTNQLEGYEWLYKETEPISKVVKT